MNREYVDTFGESHRNAVTDTDMDVITNSDLWRIIPAEIANLVQGDFSEILPEIRKMENRRKNLISLGIS